MDIKKLILSAEKNWDMLTDPYSFDRNELTLKNQKQSARKKNQKDEFSNLRFDAISGGNYFTSPSEEYNFAWRKDYYGRNKRSSVNLELLKRGTYSITDDFYGVNRF